MTNDRPRMCDRSRSRVAWVSAGVLILAVLAAYWNSLRVPFVFDDQAAIVANPEIRSFADALLPVPDGRPVSGRPLVSLSLAFNYAWSGLDPWSYHVVNLVIHTLAGLVLCALVRRTLARTGRTLTGDRAEMRRSSPFREWVPLVVALLWVLHPLQTGAVTYVVQRAESLMGLCYLLALYFFARGAESARPAGWFCAAVAACASGMNAKEVLVSAPLMILLYDRTFFAGSFSSAWRLRQKLYLGLAASWGVLFLLLLHSRDRGGTAGFGVGVSSWDYLLTQCEALVLYVRLSVWPVPLVFDRGTHLVADFLEVLPQALLILGALIALGVALKHRPHWGFLGACFFVILAPTSSVIPVASQTVAEHRMYLPLAAIIVAMVCWVQSRAGRWWLPVFLALGVAAGACTHQRNRDYRSELALWEDTVRKAPQNARAHSNLGSIFLEAGRVDEAIQALMEAERLDPRAPEIHANLCIAYVRLGRHVEAVEQGEIAVRLAPEQVDARVNLARALSGLGRVDEAVKQLEAALSLQPGGFELHVMLADLLAQAGRATGAIAHYQAALRLDDQSAETHRKLAMIFLRAGEMAGARRHGAEVVRLNPGQKEALFFWGNVCATSEDFPRAIQAYREALQIDAGYVAARNNLANGLLVTGQVDQAVAEYREVLKSRPDDRSVRENLERALALQKAGGGGERR